MVAADWSKILIVGSLITALTAPLAAGGEPEQTAEVYRIGFLAFGRQPVGSAAENLPLAEFRTTLGEIGYVEGENLTIHERWAEARLSRLPVLAAKLVQLQPDVIVASGASAVRSVMRETENIPIVIAGASDPVAEGLVSNIARPNANVTGASTLPTRELEGKRLELLKEAIPTITRVGVFGSLLRGLLG